MKSYLVCSLTLLFSTLLINPSNGQVPGQSSEPSNAVTNENLGFLKEKVDFKFVPISHATITNSSPVFLSTPKTTISRDELYTQGIIIDDDDGDLINITADLLPEWIKLRVAADVSSIESPSLNGSIQEFKRGPDNNFYFFLEEVLYKIDFDDNLIFIAGSTRGYADGTGTEAAFKGPTGLDFGPDGNIYVADHGNDRVRKVTPEGVVTTHAGTDNKDNIPVEGHRSIATFLRTNDLIHDSKGNMFVVDNLTHTIRKINLEGNVSTFVGKMVPEFIDRGNGPVVSSYRGGYADGTGTEAHFYGPNKLAIDHEDNLYLTERFNNRVRKITPDGIVTTLAGSEEGLLDGSGTNSRLTFPGDITIDNKGRLFLVSGRTIVMITPEGDVTTIAGSTTGISSKDGFGTNAEFGAVFGLDFGTDGALYTPDGRDHVIRKLVLQGKLSGDPFDHVGSHEVSLSASDGNGGQDTQSFTLMVEDQVNPVISHIFRQDPYRPLNNQGNASFKVVFNESVTNVSPLDFMVKAGGAFGNVTNAVSLDESDSVFIVTVENIATEGVLALRLSDNNDIADQYANTPVEFVASKLEEVYDMVINSVPEITSEPVTSVDDNTNYYYEIQFSDVDDDLLELSSTVLPNWLTLKKEQVKEVTTWAGSQSGFANGTGTAAAFFAIRSIVSDAVGNLYLADAGNNLIRKIDKNGVVTTLAGSEKGFLDGTGTEAKFSNPESIAIDNLGNLYVGDRDYVAIRKISVEGVVTTLLDGSYGFEDGTGSDVRFASFSDMKVGPDNYLYVADGANDRIRRVSTGGTVTTFLGRDGGELDGVGTVADIDDPRSLEFDREGNLYVSDGGNYRILKVTPEYEVSVLAGGTRGNGFGTGTEAKFRTVTDMQMGNDGNLYIVDASNHQVKVISKEGVVDLVAGRGYEGYVDGTGTEAAFWSPYDLAIDGMGNIYVADQLNIRDLIRKIPVRFTLSGSAIGQKGNHPVTLQVTDDKAGVIEHSFEILINDVTPPEFTSSGAAEVEENITSGVYQALATDTNDITYSLGDLGDENVFQISGGLVSFKIAPDHENPLDLDENNEYIIELIASDGVNTAKKSVKITVTNLNDNTPVFISDDVVSFSENGEGVVYTAIATDADLDNITFSLGSGNDELLFSLASGLLTFNTVPDFETPSDGDVNNAYVIQLLASDGTNSSQQVVTVTVTDLDDESPVFTSDETVSYAENNEGAIYTVTATDIDSDNITFSLGSGNDESLFSLASGVLTFNVSPDFETPSDGDVNNAYVIQLIASDGTNSSQQVVTVTVTDLDDESPVFTSDATVSYAENNEEAIYTVTATDIDSDNITFSLGSGNDESLFSLASGVLTFNVSPDFEAPSDGDVNNAYVIQLIASDGTNSSQQVVTVTVTDLDDESPVFTSDATVSYAENNEEAIYTVTATDIDSDNITFSLGSGNDESLFSLASGVLTFNVSPDFETPLDGDADNEYVVQLIASDGTNTSEQTLVVTIEDIDDESPIFTSGTSVSINENEGGTVYTATATDADSDNITFSLGLDNDESLFILESGTLIFKAAPDFEIPADGDADNEYIVELIASDGTNITEQVVTVTVTDVEEIITSFDDDILDDREIKIFPLPADNKITILFQEYFRSEATYRLMTIGGTLIIGERITSNMTEVNVSQLQSGLYLLLVSQGKSVVSKKVLIRR